MMNVQRHKGIKCINIPHSALRTLPSRAFTLLELMLVVAILIIALAFSYPAISDAVHRAPMSQAVKDVMDACRHARSQAILTGHPMELRIYPLEMRIEVAQVAQDTTSGSQPGISTTSTTPLPDASQSGSTSGPGYVPPSPFISSAQISTDLRIDMLDVNFTEYKEADVARVRFYPNGTCDQLTLILHSDLEERKVSLEVVTGLAQVESDPTKFNTSD
jgi:prepilin-type N-terminal cleavage/methylation domain-containing protein